MKNLPNPSCIVKNTNSIDMNMHCTPNLSYQFEQQTQVVKNNSNLKSPFELTDSEFTESEPEISQQIIHNDSASFDIEQAPVRLFGESTEHIASDSECSDEEKFKKKFQKAMNIAKLIEEL
ncbi:Hypothetical_protein [Hexamita inflata]|uniref:Hypothetical_protein n=1 Tax=Hexamita inflata TaxID=28002 RepID=A0AA86US24_9EUKA|nr:Hypothetical protein HINF_LOCUS50312 [Hexamita inflata]